MKLHRYKGNPILKPNPKNWWEAGAIFNPGACLKDGKVHLFPRVVGEYNDYISRITHFISDDGFNFEPAASAQIFISPERIYDKWACEDARVTEINGVFYFTYVALSKPVRLKDSLPSTALVATKDFNRFHRYGLIAPRIFRNKDVVLFPEKIKGKYVMLHRPLRLTKEWLNKGKNVRIPDSRLPCSYNSLPQKPSVWLSFSNDLKYLFDYRVLMGPQEWWEEEKIGAGAPPIKTKFGWLMIYHGVSASNCYRAGAALLDLKNPLKIIGRTKEPILEPREDYEKRGDVDNVVFPEGAVLIGKKLFVYYGAADKTVALAFCDLDELLEELIKK